MKKVRALLLGALLLAALPASAPAKNARIGMLIYNGTDAFMADVCSIIMAEAAGMADMVFLDSKNSQITQNDQVEQLLKSGVDALIINPVDRTAAGFLIRMILPYDVPVVFFNREPLYEDLCLYDKAYYVGSDPKDSGTMSGELIADYFREHPGADLNGDGVIQYVMLKGEPGHQDAELRSIYSIKALEGAGFAVEALASDTAMWVRSLAQEKMAGWISTFGSRIECVISNNDEMALGAIEALKAAGYFSQGRTIPVVGVDATKAAQAALRQQTLLGTVLNDAKNVADATLRLAVLLANGAPADDSAFPYPLNRGRYIWISYHKVTLETLDAP